MNSISLNQFIDRWEREEMDWLFQVTRINESKGTIQSIVEKEGLLRYTTNIKYNINDDGCGNPTLSYTILSEHSLIIDPEIVIVRNNGLNMRHQEVKDLLLKDPVFDELYNTIPDDFLKRLSKKVIENNLSDEPYEKFQLAYQISEDNKQTPLRPMLANFR